MNLYTYDQTGLKAVHPENVQAFLQTYKGVVWIDICEPGSTSLDEVSQALKFHPLAVEDTRNQRQRPKIEEYDDHLFLIVNQAAFVDHELQFNELDVFLGRNFIVSVHTDCQPLIQTVQRRLGQMQTFKHTSAEYLLYMLVDTVVDDYFPLMDQIDTEIEQLSEAIFDKPTPDKLRRLFELRRMVNEIWRVANQQRDMFGIITRHQEDLFSNHEVLEYYLRDVHDHVLRLADVASSFRDTVTSLIDLYVSATSNRLNIVVNRLAVITVVIGVLTVISGFYGMNFEQTFPSFNSPWGVPFVLTLMIGLPTVLLIVFKRMRLF